MRVWLFAFLGSLVVLGLAACGAPSTPDFVGKAATHNLYVIEAGKIASEKGQSETVKQFGLQMAEAHAKIKEELESIVQAEKLEADLPPALEAMYQGRIRTLNETKPEDFDRTYTRQQVNAFKRAVDLFDSYAERGENPALKQFAANVLPAMKGNLNRAKRLLR
jgi:putative membrane protein